MAKFIGQLDKQKASLIRHKRWIIVLVIFAILQSCTLMKLSDKQAVVMIPQFYSGKYHLTTQEVNSRYLADIAVSDAWMFFNITGSSAAYQMDLFLKRLSPRLYGIKQPQILSRIKQLKEASGSYSFFANPPVVKGNHVKVTGERITYSNGKQVSDGRLSIDITYQVNSMAVYIDGWEWQYHEST
jgi:hypothetical protein